MTTPRALGFRDGSVFRGWDSRLAPRWGDVSAGRIANAEALRHVVTSSTYETLDWMRGEELYKLQSAAEVVPTAVLSAWSSAALRSAEDLARDVRQRVRDAKQGSPPLSRRVAPARATGSR